MRVTLELGPHLLQDDMNIVRDWADLCGGEKSHFICGENGDWVVAICGLLVPERDVMGGVAENEKCKNCLRTIDKIKSQQSSRVAI